MSAIVREVVYAHSSERVWRALTDPQELGAWLMPNDFVPTVGHKFQFNVGPRLGWRGIVDCEVLEVDPPRRLVQSFRALWGEEVKSEGTSRVTWEIEPVGDSCLLKVTHDQLREAANSQLYGGWPMILSGIKTLLETGEMLTTPGSLRWSKAPESVV